MFFLILSKPTNATLVDNLASATIVDDDGFTDASLTGVVMKSAHITELRTVINKLRAARGLSPFVYTDLVLAPGVAAAKTAHISELRAALAAVYAAAGAAVPTYTDASLVAGSTPIRAIHLLELRQRVADAP
jgi:hypothetical protein